MRRTLNYTPFIFAIILTMLGATEASAFKQKYKYDMLFLCNESDTIFVNYKREFYLRKTKTNKVRAGVDFRKTFTEKGGFTANFLLPAPIDFKYLVLMRVQDERGNWTRWQRQTPKWQSSTLNGARTYGQVHASWDETKPRQLMVKFRLPSNFHLENPHMNFDLQVKAYMVCKKPVTTFVPVPPDIDMPDLSTPGAAELGGLR
jgi:hypothetical protein